MIKLESIKRLKENVDIVEVVKNYIPNLKRSGKNYFALCPFHSEKTPSFSVAPDKNLIHCFGCGYTADIIKFVQDIEHIGYYDAVEKIASQINFKLEYVNAEEYKASKEKYNEISFLTEVLTDVADVYHEILLNSSEAIPARNYLISRGLKIETIKEFKIGFAPDGNYISKNYMSIPQFKNKKYDLSILYKVGVINFKQDEKRDSLEKYDHPYDCFRNRIIFPIFNFNGKVIGFGGRILPQAVVDTDIPVYINSAETVVFNKGSVLYGLYQAKEYIKKEKRVYIVEGYMDVLLLHQEGIKNVVAPLGTALTEKQLKLLKRFPLEGVYLLFDPDEAGVEATFLAAKTILSGGEYPYVVTLEEELDPDEYILKYGKDKFNSMVENSTSIVKFIVENYIKRKKKSLSINDKISLLRKFMELIEVVTDPLISSEIIKEIAYELKIDESVIRSEQKRFVQKKDNKSYYEELINNKPYTCEEELLRICIHYPEFIEKIDEEIFSHNEDYLNIFKNLKSIYLSSRDINEVLANLNETSRNLVLRIVFDEKPDDSCLDEKYEMLCCEILKVKYKKRYDTLKIIVSEMLEGKQSFNPQIFNEFKQVIEILKIGHK
ncbi:MAG: DNA primase [Elusimicrobiota bacterium]|nr:DNA primase [Endomicrobiia bacterium]MDW8165955.1 DNA primase [Elusimicrobiota bacterium]